MKIIRLNHGNPLIPPTENAWENTDTANSGGVLLPSSPALLGLLSEALGTDIRADPDLQAHVFVSLYSAVGTLPDDPVRRQRTGLAVFTPALELKYRRSTPLFSPEPSPESADRIGIEDARVTYTNGRFYLWYCGYNGKDGRACCASSADLLHWERTAPLPGDINRTGNKDHVLFPERIGGRYWLLHRPWGEALGGQEHYVVRLAYADAPEGSWTDAGVLFRGIKRPEHESAWVGGGAPPLALGNGKFLVLYHNGCFYHDGRREYDLCACVLDFSKYPNLSEMVCCRVEPLVRPETPEERNDRLQIDIIFPMSAHIYEDALYMLYGAGDKYTCGMKLSLTELLRTIGYSD